MIAAMNKEERKVARSFLTAFSTRGAESPNKALDLFDLLCREAEAKNTVVFTDKQVEELVYGQRSGTAFPRLVLRVREKLLESLTLSINLDRENAYSERGRNLHEIRKALSQAQILQDKGETDWAAAEYERCIERAGKYELFEEWATALRLRMQTQSMSRGADAVDADARNYEKVVQGLLASHKAQRYFSQMIARTEFETKPVSLPELKKKIDELKKDMQQCGSATVAFFLGFMEAEYYQETGKYAAAAEVLRKLAELTGNHPALYSPARLASVLVNAAWNDLYLYRFRQALKTSGRVLELLPPEHFNALRCVEVSFHAHFYSGRFEEALDMLEQLLEHDAGSAAEFRTGKRQYQKACVLFMQKKFEEAHRILVDLNPIEDDAEGWNIAHRLLHILNDIEREHMENAFNRIEAFRKHLSRIGKKSEVPARFLAIYDVLQTLANNRFDFVRTHTRKNEELKKLSDPGSALSWKILSPELIIFDQWFDSNVFRKPFKLVMPEYVEAEKE